MRGCKVTVVKKLYNEDMAKECGQIDSGPCKYFKLGQEFITYDFSQPKDFLCGLAWNDLSKVVTAFLCDGNFSSGIFSGCMKNEKTMIACCTDGIRPVVFKIEKFEDNR